MPKEREVILLSEVAMNANFARLFTPEVVVRESEFYGYLTSNAGKKVSAKYLALVMTVALNEHFPRSLHEGISLRNHVRAMLGDDPTARLVLEEFIGIMENLSKRLRI